MTEKFPPLSTHIVPPSQTTVLSPKPVPTLLNHVSSKVETVDEEPYTIKCICDFADDDGNTIYCDTCDTWQHIECYYPHNIQDAYREDFAHSCVDCKPRPLDRQSAMARQAFRRTKPNAENDQPERKTKRPPSKSHKKTKKPSDLYLNGQSGSDSNTKQTADHPGHKKSKSTHRPSQSISVTAKRSPSYGQKNGNPHGHPPSPATTPPDVAAESGELHSYSSGLVALHNDDRDIQIVQTNSFHKLEISNAMSLWLRDHEKLQAETGWEFKDVFQQAPSTADSNKAPRVSVLSKKQPISADTVLHLQYLTAPGPSAIEKDTPLVELNGQLGYQKDYCSDPNNRWEELSSPLPFVFFHPMLPLYIDTRREGSNARYVRRSCRPNAMIDTYLSEGSEYHFWLVSDRQIAPNEQVTISWDFRFGNEERSKKTLQLLGLADDEASSGQPEYDPNQVELYTGLQAWLMQILSEHGGCACDLGSDCAFIRFYHKYINRSPPKSGSKKKSRKTKAHAISPTSTGQATNSRAASEGHGEDGADNDSGSSRSKPPSRDMTPAPRQGSFDTLGILTEPTDRDKRKVAMVEDSFRRMEQQQPPRKKKRTSDGNVSSASTKSKRGSTGHAAGQPNGMTERRYVDASTNRSMSASPHSTAVPNTFKHSTSRHGSIPIPSRHSSVNPRPEYCDASVQTDPVQGEWYSPARQTPKVKRRVVSLSKRLLENRQRVREEQRRLSTASPTSVVSAMVKMDLDSPKDLDGRPPSPVVSKDTTAPPLSPLKTDQTGDAIMTDLSVVSPTDTRSVSVATLEATSPVTTKVKSPELRVQLPPVPPFNNVTTTASPTPLSASAAVVQSPFSAGNLPSPFGPGPAVNGTAVTPSPVKKKLSLSDYKSRMKAKPAGPWGTSLKPPAISEETKSPTTTDVTMTDSPTSEKVSEQ